MKFSSLAASLGVKIKTLGAASDENFVKMTTFPFQCLCLGQANLIHNMPSFPDVHASLRGPLVCAILQTDHVLACFQLFLRPLFLLTLRLFGPITIWARISRFCLGLWEIESWWRHNMEMLSTSLILCEENPLVDWIGFLVTNVYWYIALMFSSLIATQAVEQTLKSPVI